MNLSKLIVISSIVSVFAAFNANASDPTCTKEDKAKWMPFDSAKQEVEYMGYSIKKFKTTSTGCYELYGHDAEGKRVEIYFDPTNLAVVKEEKDD